MPDGGHLILANSIVEPTAEQIERHNLAPGVALARCSVSDTGCGIPDDVLPRIFDPFYTTKEKGKGTGLGLPIVQRVALEAGGFIEVESVLNQGTTFHLHLPMVQERLSPVVVTQHLPLVRGKGRVLVVDDVDLLRDFTQGFLQSTGLTVVVASSGLQALKMLEESTEPVDLMFTDYNMPGMNGLELIEVVATRWPKTKFVLASGFLSDAAYARVQAFNVSILSKPYEMSDASKMVMDKLAENGAAAPPVTV
jgi:two-component system cell cycle sensor histidine kinase/response regulator CckA